MGTQWNRLAAVNNTFNLLPYQLSFSKRCKCGAIKERISMTNIGKRKIVECGLRNMRNNSDEPYLRCTKWYGLKAGTLEWVMIDYVKLTHTSRQIGR